MLRVFHRWCGRFRDETSRMARAKASLHFWVIRAITKASATPGLRWAFYALHRWVLGLVYGYMTKLNPEFAMKSTTELDHFGRGKTLEQTKGGGPAALP